MTQPWGSDKIIAPHVMEDNGRPRMWYHGLTRDDPITGERFRIGYAEAPFERPTRFDVNEDRRVNSLDVEAGLQSPADWSNSGDVDFFDALRLLEAVDRGCP